jgi:hypothetical protein
MSDDTRLVFGISTGPAWNDRGFVFLPVLGEIVRGRLEVLPDPRDQFPTEGNVYLHSEFWIPSAGGAGTWRVRRTKEAGPGQRQAEYSVVTRGQPIPIEIISLPVGPESPDRIREALREGLEVGYSVGNAVLIQLGDGSIIGPVRCDSMHDGLGFSCRLDALNEVLGHWPDGKALSAVKFRLRGPPRTFAGLMELPEPAGFFDCSEAEHAIRSILRLANDGAMGVKELTKRQLDHISRTVAELRVPEKLRSRLTRVRVALESAGTADAELEEFRKYLESLPRTHEELTKIKREAKESEELKLAQEKSALSTAVGGLRESKRKLEQDVGKLKVQIGSVQAEYETVVDQVVAGIRERVASLRDEPGKALAEIAILRPFLIGSQSEATSASPVSLRLPIPATTATLDSSIGLLDCLQQNMTAAGLSRGSAERVSREVLAAAQVGQMAIFSGSLASSLARACGSALAAETAFECRIPVGLLNSELVGSCLESLVQESQRTDLLCACVLEGMNRSAEEAYAVDVRRLIVDQQLMSAGSRSVVLLGTIVEGPSSLSPGPSLSELGPIIDTDCLMLGSTRSQGASSGGKVTYRQWTACCEVASLSNDSSAELSHLIEAMEGDTSVLWRRVVQNAYKRLLLLTSEKELLALQSIAFSWLIPRACLCGVSAERFVAELEAATSSAELPDPRVKRLLTMAFADDRKSDEP